MICTENVLGQIPDSFVSDNVIDHEALPLDRRTKEVKAKEYHPLAQMMADQVKPKDIAYTRLGSAISDIYTHLSAQQAPDVKEIFHGVDPTGDDAAQKASDYFNVQFLRMVKPDGPPSTSTSQGQNTDPGYSANGGLGMVMEFLYGSMAGIGCMRTLGLTRKTPHKTAATATNKHSQKTLAYAAQLLTFGPKAIFTSAKDASYLSQSKAAMLLEYGKKIIEVQVAKSGTNPPEPQGWALFDNTRAAFLSFLHANGFGGDGPINWEHTVQNFHLVFSIEKVATLLMQDIELVLDPAYSQDPETQMYPCLEAPPSSPSSNK